MKPVLPRIDCRLRPTRNVLYNMLLAAMVVSTLLVGRAESSQAAIQSPDGRNSIDLQSANDDHDQVLYTIRRDGRTLIGPSPLGPVLSVGGQLGEDARIVDVQLGKVDESFELPWGKTIAVTNRCSFAVVTLATADSNLQWQVELRAYDDGVAFRYRLVPQDRIARVRTPRRSDGVRTEGRADGAFQYARQLHDFARIAVRAQAAC